VPRAGEIVGGRPRVGKTAHPSGTPAAKVAAGGTCADRLQCGTVSLDDIETEARFAVMDYGSKKTAVARSQPMRAAFQHRKSKKRSSLQSGDSFQDANPAGRVARR